MVHGPSPIGLRRLFQQRIVQPEFSEAAQVAAWLGAMQGQDYAGTKWAFGLRMPGSTDSSIEQALDSGQVLRTWALRGTLHYVAPEDIHWLVGLVGPRIIAGNGRRYRELELDEPTLTRSTALIAETLQDGQQRTRPELFAVLEAHQIATAGQRGVYLLQRAGLERLIYQGPVVRNVTTFRALSPGKTLAKDEALARLALRYFLSHGPATLTDFVAWADLPIADARAGLAAVKSALIEETIDGQTYYQSPDAVQAPDQSLYLLPGFDEFVLGYRDRDAVLDPPFANAICPGGNGMFMNTIVIDGRIVGTWKRTIRKATVDLAVIRFRPFSADEFALLEAAAAEYAAYLGLTFRLAP